MYMLLSHVYLHVIIHVVHVISYSLIALQRNLVSKRNMIFTHVAATFISIKSVAVRIDTHKKKKAGHFNEQNRMSCQ